MATDMMPQSEPISDRLKGTLIPVTDKSNETMIRELLSYHDSQIQRLKERIGYHEQMREHVVALSRSLEIEVPSAQVQAIYVGHHKVDSEHACYIEGVHYHGPNRDTFYRPDKGSHWKIDGQCRIIINNDGGWLNCDLHS